MSSDRKYFFFTIGRFDPVAFDRKKMDRKDFENQLDGAVNGSTNIYLIDFNEVMKLRKDD